MATNFNMWVDYANAQPIQHKNYHHANATRTLLKINKMCVFALKNLNLLIISVAVGQTRH